MQHRSGCKIKELAAIKRFQEWNPGLLDDSVTEWINCDKRTKIHAGRYLYDTFLQELVQILHLRIRQQVSRILKFLVLGTLHNQFGTQDRGKSHKQTTQNAFFVVEMSLLCSEGKDLVVDWLLERLQATFPC